MVMSGAKVPVRDKIVENRGRGVKNHRKSSVRTTIKNGGKWWYLTDLFLSVCSDGLTSIGQAFHIIPLRFFNGGIGLI